MEHPHPPLSIALGFTPWEPAPTLCFSDPGQVGQDSECMEVRSGWERCGSPLSGGKRGPCPQSPPASPMQLLAAGMLWQFRLSMEVLGPLLSSHWFELGSLGTGVSSCSSFRTLGAIWLPLDVQLNLRLGHVVTWEVWKRGEHGGCKVLGWHLLAPKGSCLAGMVLTGLVSKFSRLIVKVGTIVWLSGWTGSSCCGESVEQR